MAELKNTFSWSVSAREDFNECPRRRYWAKYAMWNGWKTNASDEQRLAYRLTKMENRFTIQGNAVEHAVMWALAETRAGRTPDTEKAYLEIARPYLNRCWQESKNRLWRANPKLHCCLHEHYYPEHHQISEPDMVNRVIETVKRCIENFRRNLLPQLCSVPQSADISIATVGAGDPEFFMLDDIKVYAIPDYACHKGDILDIYDWKSGAPRASHNDQMAIYSLWACRKHQYKPEKITVHLEYLADGKSLQAPVSGADTGKTADLIRQSAADMAEYLEDADLRRNHPLPREHWEMTPEMRACRRCNFFELCRPELEG